MSITPETAAYLKAALTDPRNVMPILVEFTRQKLGMEQEPTREEALFMARVLAAKQLANDGVDERFLDVDHLDDTIERVCERSGEGFLQVIARALRADIDEALVDSTEIPAAVEKEARRLIRKALPGMKMQRRGRRRS